MMIARARDAAAMMQDWLSPLARLGASVLVGGVIGWERQLRGRPAGLRTHMLVSLGAAVSVLTLSGASADSQSHAIQGVATGIGFLCAGDILHRMKAGDEHVTGLTSAAALWVTAALGMAAATGQWPVMVIGTVGTLLTLTIVRNLEKVTPVLDDSKSGDPPAGPR
ncbi:MAG TPA: MgtC/SapB family protein [Polyangia bacterium]|jgi:putative Mg2+ transporter-C (MgtC) family protein|nr:MgtC/SapB family protein [Polyangia bacterium]